MTTSFLDYLTQKNKSTYGAMEFLYEILYYHQKSELSLVSNSRNIKTYFGIMAHKKAFEFYNTDLKFILVIDSKLNNE